MLNLTIRILTIEFKMMYKSTQDTFLYIKIIKDIS